MKRLPPLALLVVVSATGTGIAQTDTGPILASPVAVTVTANTPLASGRPVRPVVYSKKSGFGAVAPAPAAGPVAGPDFRVRAIVGRLGGNRPVDIDAMSIGVDRIPADPCTGILDHARCNCWTNLVFSVRDRSAADAASPVIRREAGRIGGAGADVFGYTHSTGNIIDSTLLRETSRISDAIDIGLFDPARPAVRGQITSLDAHIPIYSLDANVQASLPPELAAPTVYFSVSAATANNVPRAFWMKGGVMTAKSGGTILRADWDATASRWIPRAPLYTAAELGFVAGEDIDALCYDAENENTIISLTLATSAGRSQLLFVTRCTDGTLGTVPYSETVDATTRPITTGAGVGSSNITGACEKDPNRYPVQAAGGLPFMSFLIGTPVGSRRGPFPTDLNASVFRNCAGPVPTWDLHVTGSTGGTGSSVTFLFWEAGPTSSIELGRALRPSGTEPTTVRFALPSTVWPFQGFQVPVFALDFRAPAASVSRVILISL